MKTLLRITVGVVLCVLVGFSVINYASGQNISRDYRICVPKKYVELCEQMRKEGSPDVHSITCIAAQDKIDCIEKIAKDEADFLPLDPEEIYVAHRYKKDAFSIVTEIRQGQFQHRDYRYEPVAVIRKSSGINSISDLRGKKSCHTGFGRNAGWKIPFSHLMDKNELPKLCEGIDAPTPEKDMYAISNYFESGCAPGIWVPEKFKDKELKEKYPNMCSLCDNPVTCDRNDKYGGYEGALKCLTLQHADIAWTKMDAVESFFKLKEGQPLPSVSEYAFLCTDGTSMPLTTPEPCSLAKRPWTAHVASSRLTTSQIDELQKQISLLRNIAVNSTQSTNIIPSWLKPILGFDFDKKTNVPDVEYHNPPNKAKLTTPFIYLNDRKNYSLTIEKPSCATKTVVKICVRSEVEESKCRAMKMASMGRRILPSFHCVLGESTLDCIQKVSKGEADVVSLDPKEADWARRNYKLQAILSELEETEVGESGPFRFAVAVIKAEAVGLYKNISDLRGKKSCHGSGKSLAGWNVPLSVLRDTKEIQGQTCALPGEMANYFGNKSCVPGVGDLKMDWLPKKSFCSLCAGDGEAPGQPLTPETLCVNNDAERYFGDAGAVRCLQDGVADVAFTDHVGLRYKALLIQDPNINLKSEDFLLLCPNGKTMEVAHFQHCNWGKIPSRKIVTRGGSENLVEREDARLTLLKVSDTFSPASQNDGESIFKLFGTYFGNNDLLFQDTSVGLCDEALAKAENENLISDFDYCTTGSARRNFSSGFLALVCAIFVSLWASWK